MPSRASFLLLVLSVSLFSFARSDDRAVLMKLKESLQESNTNVFDSWTLDTPHCNFSGVSCNSNNSVRSIELSGIRLTGNVPFDSVCQLQSLQTLDLSINSLSGVVTEGLRNCTKLQYLNLSWNSFNGRVPDLSSLGELRQLQLDNNSYTGQFPWKSLENLTNLTVLTLGDNTFDVAPFPLEVLNLKKLTILYLTNCSLEGRIPVGLGDLIELQSLQLSHNYLTGEIPGEIVKLSQLGVLELYDNRLTGKFPVGFGNLTGLQYLDVSNNSLEGDLSELKSLNQIINLQLFENRFWGGIPEEFGDFKYIEGISLYSNKFTGPLPQNLGSWSDFDFVDASDNLLTGPIPPNMCKKGVMTAILLINNLFTGGIPKSYSACSSLTRLRVSNNSLSGRIPAGIWGFPKLEFIDLAMNQFEGSVTSDIGNANSLTQLRIQSNRFTGNIPSEFSKASSLGSIDMSFNQFSGQIPVSIGELKKLNTLYLQGNMFSGSIPDSLSECTSLNIINLAQNSLTDQIPATLGLLSSLNSLNLSSNRLSGQIPSTLSRLKLSLLDLSYNKLAGLIPQALANQANNGSFAGNTDLCSQDIRYFQLCSSESSGSNYIKPIIFCFLAGSLILLVSNFFFWICSSGYVFFRRKQKEQNKSFKSDSWEIKSFRQLSFSEDEILKLIKQENLIGEGGSGNVYRVNLPNGVDLAVKHIWNVGGQGRSQRSYRTSSAMLMRQSGNLPEFEAEVATLSSIRHVNVVKLYCSITSEDSSLLVYEFLPNGSLWDRLHTRGNSKLDWKTRYEIALGAAKGLEYLHHGCDRPVIHRDVKSSNILLDEFFKPRIADFGLAKMMQSNGGNISTLVIAGTHGYIAPEYAYTCKVSEKSDVYSFGVVLMELVTGKRPIEPEFGENKDIVYWVCSKMARGENASGMVESSIPEMFKEYAVKVLRIGMICTAKLPALRPSMRAVIRMLIDAQPCSIVEITICKDGDGEKPVVDKVEKLKNSP